MMNATSLIWIAALALGAEADTASSAPKAPTASVYVGNVIPLSEVLAKRKIPHDSENASALALVLEDGTIYPLVKNAGSRLFFLDKRLLNRPMQITGSLVPNAQLLNVESVLSVKEGVLHDVYYWCEKCQLRFTHAGICSCCGMETELWEEPIKTPTRAAK